MAHYPNLFSEWSIRNCQIKNRVVFPPTCPTWVSDLWNGLFIDMATGRRSVTDLLKPLKEMGISVEAIGDATAPRSTYEAVYEGHRQARKL